MSRILFATRPLTRLGSPITLALLALVAGVVAYFALRPSPCPAPPFPVRFVDVTEAAGIRFRHYNGAAGRKLLPETMGGGVAVLDYDATAGPDLFFVNGCPWPGEHGPASRTT
jgi:enediyne biosynthesis protein E4